MKIILFILLLSAPTVLVMGQTDSTYWPPPSERVALVRDTLNAERRMNLQTATENTLLHQQNERLMSRQGRFWGLIILAAVAALAQAAARGN